MKKAILLLIVVLFVFGKGYSENNGIPLIGSKAPSFTAKSTNGTITFPDDFGKSWKILFSHPQDFTPVCSSELLELAHLQKDFEKLGVKIAVISTDDVNTHNLWKEQLEGLDYKNRGPQKIDFPIIDDHSAAVSRRYGMLHEPTSTNKDIRGVFIIDGNNVIRSINFYPMTVGRNMDEIKRIVVALETTEKDKVYTPADWKKGDDVLVPYFPYTKEELSANPELQNEYYNVGNRMWFKRVNRQTAEENK